MECLTAARVRELFEYAPETGIFTRRIATGHRGCNRAGERAGRLNQLGYRQIGIDGARFQEHRLAWLYVTGDWPLAFIDHINGVRDDNRFSNLRDVSRTVNAYNQRNPKSNNLTGGFLGVSFDKKAGKFKACIHANGKQKQIGRFETAELARDAYRAAKPLVHGLEVTWPK